MISTLINALKLKEEIPEGWYEFSVSDYKCIELNHKKIVRIKILFKSNYSLFYDLELNSNYLIQIRNFFKALGFNVKDDKPYKPEWNKIIGCNGQLYFKWNWYISAEGVVGYQPEIEFNKEF